jgi:hypothetical protein
MAYELPGVQLEQIPVLPNVTLNDAALYATIVAPLYRNVVDKMARDNQAFPVGGISIGNNVIIDYPIKDSGAVIDLSSIQVYVVNGILEWLVSATGSKGKLTAGEYTFEDPNTDFLALGVLPGDTFIVGGTLNDQYIIKNVDQHILTFTYAIFRTINPTTDGGYSITRKVSRWLLSSNSYTATQDHVNITSATNGSKIFLSGQFNFTYRALRKDKVGLYKYSSLDEVLADMEVDSIENKLGYFIKNGIIPANGNSTSFLVYILDEDSPAAYMAALSELIGDKRIYMLVPLSNDTSVKNAYRSHVKVVSAPEESAFRVLFTSPESLVTTSVLAEGTKALAYNALA